MRSYLKIAILVIVSLIKPATSSCRPSIPAKVPSLDYNGKCFAFIIATKADYDQAEKTCHLNGGILALVKDKATNTALTNYLKKIGNHNKFWIGANDRGDENVYYWADGTPVIYTAFHWWDSLTQSTFKENCAAMMFDGYWYETKCYSEKLTIGGILLWDFKDSRSNFICQFEIQPISNTTPSPTSPTMQTSGPSDTTQVPTIIPVTSSTECPPLNCEKDCGLAGYKSASSGCLMCECGSLD